MIKKITNTKLKASSFTLLFKHIGNHVGMTLYRLLAGKDEETLSRRRIRNILKSRPTNKHSKIKGKNAIKSINAPGETIYFNRPHTLCLYFSSWLLLHTLKTYSMVKIITDTNQNNKKTLYTSVFMYGCVLFPALLLLHSG